MQLLDVVAVTADRPEQHLIRGQVGTIVDELDSQTVLVEFADLDGIAYAIEAIPTGALLRLTHGPMPAS